MQLTTSELREVFDDGKPHEMTCVNAIFLDGAAVGGSLQPLVMVKRVSDFAEFDEAVADYTEAIGRAYEAAWRADSIAVRACARAGVVFSPELMALAASPGREPSEAMSRATTVLGFGLAIWRRGRSLADGLTLPAELRDEFERYLQETPEDPGEVAHG